MRKWGGGSQLSQEGVDYARKLGASLGPFAQIVTSVVPRARETAIAMGFAVDYEVVTQVADEELYAEAEDARWWESPQPFAAAAHLLDMRSATCRHAHTLLAIWRDILTALPDESAALYIGHAGDLELALIACFPNADHTMWGAQFGPLEGARLRFGGHPEHFTALEFLRA
jgi:broad specificity phosphatase PhoE